VTLQREAGELADTLETKFYPGPRLTMLTLLDPEGRTRNRLGGGVALHVPVPRVSFELDVFERVDGEEHRAVLATFGGAAYSDHLGRGVRRFLNPYVGLRMGYGYLGASAFALQADAGLELVKLRAVLVDLNTRFTGFITGDGTDTALITALSVVVAF
jgi:hypothetical protein